MSASCYQYSVKNDTTITQLDSCVNRASPEVVTVTIPMCVHNLCFNVSHCMNIYLTDGVKYIPVSGSNVHFDPCPGQMSNEYTVDLQRITLTSQDHQTFQNSNLLFQHFDNYDYYACDYCNRTPKREKGESLARTNSGVYPINRIPHDY